MKKFLLLLMCLCFSGCTKNGDKTSLGWCIWEIRKHENYEQVVYTYQELNPYYEIQKETNNSKNRIDAFIITTYSSELRTEWFCLIEYKNTSKRYLNEHDVLAIDCDIIWEAVIYE